MCTLWSNTRVEISIATFANEMLVDRIKVMAADPITDSTVKKKLFSVLISWHHQFKDDPKMQLVAGLSNQLKENRPGYAEAYKREQDRLQSERAARQEAQRAQLMKEEEERIKAKAERDRLKAQQKNKVKRPPFDFNKVRSSPRPLCHEASKRAQEKPQIMAAVGTATQCANSLINALQHVNREKDTIAENTTVQDYLVKTKTARKQIVRYIQLVEDDPTGDYIGTLISTNELIVSAFTLYDRLSGPPEHDSDDEREDVSAATAASKQAEQKMANLDLGEVDKLQVRQRHAVERAASNRNLQTTSTAQADLADLDFGARSLQAPMQPARADAETFDRGSLSEYSDYDSSEDEATHNARASTSMLTTSYGGYERGRGALLDTANDDDDGVDPFADPDPEDGVSTPGIAGKPRMEWCVCSLALSLPRMTCSHRAQI